MSKHYDAIVVGGGLAATIAGALLAKRGLRAVLVDQGELTATDARLFDLIPSDEGSIAMSLVHSELAVREDLRIKVAPVEPLLQVIFPDARLDLVADRSAAAAEIRKRLGVPTDLLDTLLESLDTAEEIAGQFLSQAGELPATGFFAKRTFQSAARKHPELTQSIGESHLFPLDKGPISELLLAPLPFLSHLDARRPEQATVARFARVIGRFLRGTWTFSDGRTLRRLFLDAGERKGLTLERTAVETIQAGKQLEIRLTGRRDPITADFLVDASTDLSGLDALTPKKKDLALLLQSAKPRGWLHAYALDVDPDVLPPGLATYLLLLNGRKDPERFDANDPEAEDRPIFLTVRRNEEDRVRLLAVHPLTSARAHAQRIEELEMIIHARISRLIPFLEEGDPEQVRVDVDHPLYQPELDHQTGLTGVPCRTGVRNVLLAGPAVLPGLGVEGAYLTALQAADAVESAVSGTKHPKTLAARA